MTPLQLMNPTSIISQTGKKMKSQNTYEDIRQKMVKAHQSNMTSSFASTFNEN